MSGSLIRKNAAHLIVLLRTAFIYLVIHAWERGTHVWLVTGLLLLAISTNLDWVDGWLARQLKVQSSVGGLLDTMGDRITENVLMMYLAYRGLISVWIPIIFVSRSFASDFIRSINFQHGIGTFQINRSLVGYLCVSSMFARSSYLLLKMTLFFAAGIVLLIENNGGSSLFLREGLRIGSFVVVAFNLLRFVVLLYDDKEILKNEFGNS